MTDTETKGTLYRVFHSDETGTALGFVGEKTAMNDLKAIKAVVGGEPVHASYVAIPARNLRVRTVTVKSEPKVVIS
jgi:hypothetical protein